MKRFEHESSFILHRKPYLESSLLVDVFTEHHGRVSLIARGGRRQQAGQAFLWQSFIPLNISFQGKTELLTATHIEKQDRAIALLGSNLLMGLYLNELLIAVLPKQDAYPEIFQAYFKTLKCLEQGIQEPALRVFEKKLLSELGYGIPYHQDTDQRLIDPGARYQLKALKGFERVDSFEDGNPMDLDHLIFSGQLILDILNEHWTEDSLLSAKYMMRYLFKPLLNHQTLKVRELYHSPLKMQN